MEKMISLDSKFILGDTLSAGSPDGMMQNTDASAYPSLGFGRAVPCPSQSTVRLASNSKPIFATDRFAFKSDRTSRVISFAIHVFGITLVLVLALKTPPVVMPPPTTIVTPMDFKVFIPPVIRPVAKLMTGGGGQHARVKAPESHRPLIVKIQLTHPQIIRNDRSKLEVEPISPVNMPDNNNLPNLGVTKSPQIAIVSQGRSSGSGFGQGLNGGLGAGYGSGVSSGTGSGYGGGLMSVGDGVSAPHVLHSVAPEFTEEARRANYQGNVSIRLIVDSQGNPQNVRLASHLGMGLEEKAVEAVRQYKFSPAIYQGHPVSVQIVIDVDFHLH